MFKSNFKKAFTLAELMVVLAIIGILSASAMNIFSGAIAQARDSNRVTDLNVMKAALESYYSKYKVYPQPAKQTEDNVWGYKNGSDAIATCGVATMSGEIITSESKNICGGDILLSEKKIEKITCEYAYGEEKDSLTGYVDGKFNGDSIPFDLLSSTILVLDGEEMTGGNNLVLQDTYEFDNLDDVCQNYMESIRQPYLESDEGDGTYSYTIDSKITAASGGINDSSNSANLGYLKQAFTGAYLVHAKSKKFSSTAAKKETIIGFKGTLTAKSGLNSVYESNEEKIKKSFSSFLEDNASDPKYKGSKYSNYGFGYYPYSVFRDNIGERVNYKLDVSNKKTYIGGTSYQIAATLEKQDDDGIYNPETLIVGNYKRPKNSNGKIKKGYPRSLFGNGYDVIINKQKEGQQGKYVKKPNGTSNKGIPYPVEEIE